ncbi:MAG: hypothetical protein GXO74_06045 [Calditrichaeota bacterium]|nr:hypothetical protein [Calditrichota bacterium]
MLAEKKKFSPNMSYTFVIRSTFFFPFEEANLKIFFTITEGAHNFVGYYHLTIENREQSASHGSENDSMESAQRAEAETNSMNQIKQIAMA